MQKTFCDECGAEVKGVSGENRYKEWEVKLTNKKFRVTIEYKDGRAAYSIPQDDLCLACKRSLLASILDKIVNPETVDRVIEHY